MLAIPDSHRRRSARFTHAGNSNAVAISGDESVLLVSPASIVEIDLLRVGPRLPMSGAPGSDYCVLVSRRAMWPVVEIWPIQLRQKLPVIPIPLKGDIPDAHLDLQALLHQVYDAAGYEDYLYATPPEPLLFDADAKWAKQIIASPVLQRE